MKPLAAHAGLGLGWVGIGLSWVQITRGITRSALAGSPQLGLGQSGRQFEALTGQAGWAGTEVLVWTDWAGCPLGWGGVGMAGRG